VTPSATAFGQLPAFAAWRHRGVRDGFEVVFFRAESQGHLIEGHSAAVEGGQPWAVEYSIKVDADWVTRQLRVRAQSAGGCTEVRLESSGPSDWLVDGAPAPHLRGCVDVDLEASVFTNALPVRRLALEAGNEAQVPAAFVRAPDLAVERLDQRYLRLDDEGGQQRYHYAAPRFDYTGRLGYDSSGLLLEYPGIAERTI
jgi:hypothetical protein